MKKEFAAIRALLQYDIIFFDDLCKRYDKFCTQIGEYILHHDKPEYGYVWVKKNEYTSMCEILDYLDGNGCRIEFYDEFYDKLTLKIIFCYSPNYDDLFWDFVDPEPIPELKSALEELIDAYASMPTCTTTWECSYEPLEHYEDYNEAITAVPYPKKIVRGLRAKCPIYEDAPFWANENKPPGGII